MHVVGHEEVGVQGDSTHDSMVGEEPHALRGERAIREGPRPFQGCDGHGADCGGLGVGPGRQTCPSTSRVLARALLHKSGSLPDINLCERNRALRSL